MKSCLVVEAEMVSLPVVRGGVRCGGLAVEEGLGRRRERVVDEVLAVLLAKVQDPLPRIPSLRLLDLRSRSCQVITGRYGRI